MIDLVLVPGHLCNATLWEHQVSGLEGLARSTIADVTADDSLAGMAARLLSKAPPRFSLAGLSMGGMVCMEVMRQAPERVERLALLDTNPGADNAERAAQRRRMLDRFNAGEVDTLVQEFLELVVPPNRLDEDSLIRPMRAMMKDVAEKAFPAQVKALIERQDSRADMPDYDLPVSLICGRQDKLTPLAFHEEMAGLIPGADLTVIEDCAHMSTMERPDTVNEALRGWLKRG
ncbi:alpha/beta fold hydrolase [Hwanghaeella sp.]|uniref:alpha/beta fold hydrolase n=1 Tax=Hwanghaeella sp. TaxID=2605943 RepID=UPI003CCB9C41